MSKKSNGNLESTGEVLERIPKPKKKQVYAPVDVNLPALPLFEIRRRTTDTGAIWKSSDGSVRVAFMAGKPSINAQKMLIYLLSKIHRGKGGRLDIARLKKEPVSFYLSEICSHLGIHNNRNNRKRIKEDLIKLGYISIGYHNKYSIRGTKGEASYTKVKSVALFEVDLFNESESDAEDRQLPLWQNTIKFNEIILRNLDSRMYRLLSVEQVRNLQSSVAVRIHGILSLHNQYKEWPISLNKLAEQIPILVTSERKAKQTIKKASDELKKKGFISGIRFYKNGDGQEIVVFTFPQRLINRGVSNEYAGGYLTSTQRGI